ncbi:MAG: TPM domain-containing protein [Lachnospiraceae bacterium]|jgi:uncharacterized protein
MNKRIISFLTVIVLSVLLAMPVYAANNDKVVDNADLLSDSEESSLEEKLISICDSMQFDIVIVTEDDIGGKSVEAYADDYFDYNGYGYGDEGDGALLLVDMGSRKWWISTKGYGITALTDFGIQEIGDELAGYLSDGDYYEGFSVFTDRVEEYVGLAKNGTPVDVNSKAPSGRKGFKVTNLLIGLVAGFAIAFIVTGSMKAKLKTIRHAAEANDYVEKDSLRIRTSRDTFLYRNVVRRAKPKENSGGSSTHTSSSGSTHGGGGGSF